MITFGDKCTLNVHQAIRLSNCGIARRINKHTHRDEYARKTPTGIRIIKDASDWTVVRSLSNAQELAHEWSSVNKVDETNKRSPAHITRDLLLLVGLKVPLVVIREWSGWEREQVDTWASACIARASDNAGVRIPERPRCLKAYKEQAF